MRFRLETSGRFQGVAFSTSRSRPMCGLFPLRYSCRPLPSSCLLPGLNWATKSLLSPRRVYLQQGGRETGLNKKRRQSQLQGLGIVKKPKDGVLRIKTTLCKSGLCGLVNDQQAKPGPEEILRSQGSGDGVKYLKRRYAVCTIWEWISRKAAPVPVGPILQKRIWYLDMG